MARRRLLLLQIDGLAGTRLARVIAAGQVPNLAAFCGSRVVKRRWISVPPSTPAFQSALLYGAADIVHGYAWFDREHGMLRRMDVPEDINHIEHQLRRAAPWPPLLAVAEAATYFIIFFGGAARALLNITTGIFKPARWVQTGGLVLGLLLGCVRLPLELARALLDFVRFVIGQRVLAFEPNWLAMRVLHATFFEETSTAAALAELRAGTPVVFLDFVAYDEAAHRRGPDHPVALAQLRRIDRRVGRLLRAGRRHGYTAVVFSDHGQSASVPYADVTGRSLAVSIFEACARPGVADTRFLRLADRLDRGRGQAARVRKWPPALRLPLERLALLRARRAAGRLERDYRFPAGAVAVATGGSIAHVYVGRAPAGTTLEEIEARFPRLVETLAASRGVGLVVARRSANGPVVFYRGRAVLLSDRAGLARLAPFANPDAAALALELIAKVTAMRTAGDLILYGAYAPAGPVTFEPERGSHGGIHPDELDVFLVETLGFAIPASEHLDPVALGIYLRGTMALEAARGRPAPGP